MKKPKYDTTRLPLYDIEIGDDEDVTGIKFISIVAKPAIEVKGIAFNDEDEEPDADCSDLHEHDFADTFCDNPPCHPRCVCFIDARGYWQNRPFASKSGVCTVCKANKKRFNKNLYGKKVNESRNFSMEFAVKEDQQILAGPTMIPYKNIYRSDESGEYMVRFTPDTIKKIVQKFFKNNNNSSINVEHTNEMVKGYITEHWIVEDPMYDKSKLYGFNLPVGSHFMLVKIEDEKFWQEQVKGENKKGFSIEGILGQKLVSMSKMLNMEEFIDSLTEIELASILSFVEPGKKETEDEFIGRCIPYVINDGTAKDNSQAYAICKTKWDTK
jgi:hypothetical protein